MTTIDISDRQLDTASSAAADRSAGRLTYHPPSLREHGDMQKITLGGVGVPTDGLTGYEGDDAAYGPPS